jgi:transposase
MAMQKRKTKEFKDEACKLVLERGYSIANAARELGLVDATLAYWLEKRGYRKPERPALSAAGQSNDPQALKAHIRELEARLRRAEMEKDILKKATAYFATQK